MKSTLSILAIAIAAVAVPTAVGQQAGSTRQDPFQQANAALGSSSYQGFLGDDKETVRQSPRATPREAKQQTAAFTGYLDDTEVGNNRKIPSVSPSAFFGYVEDDSNPYAGYSTGETSYGISKGKISSGKCDGPASCGGMLWDSWVSFEYMNTWTKGRYLPPLITTGPNDGILPDGTILFGGKDIGGDYRGGGRLSFGSWLQPDMRWGVVGRLFGIEGDKTRYATNSDEIANINRPFFNTDLVINQQDSLIVTKTGIRTGDIDASAENDVLGAEAYARYLLACGSDYRLDLIGGYQFSRIDDSLVISHRMLQTGAGGGFSEPVGSTYFFEDNFDATNEFHGGQLGLLGEYSTGRLTFSVLAKVGLGNMHQTVNIRGRSVVNDTFVTSNYNSGLLAMQSTNAGEYSKDEFVWVPEAEVKLNYCLTDHIDFTLGYTFMYWTSVALAGEQIDTSVQDSPTVNSTGLFDGTIAGPANPAFTGIHDASFWLQGLNVGITLRH